MNTEGFERELLSCNYRIKTYTTQLKMANVCLSKIMREDISAYPYEIMKIITAYRIEKKRQEFLMNEIRTRKEQSCYEK